MVDNTAWCGCVQIRSHPKTCFVGKNEKIWKLAGMPNRPALPGREKGHLQTG
jgi:hypothetical protein